MTETSKGSRQPKGQTQPWIFQRMLQRAQPHLTERDGTAVAPWVIIAGVIALMLVTAMALFLWTGQVLNVNSPPASSTQPIAIPPSTSAPTLRVATVAPTATQTPTPAVPTATPGVVKHTVKPGDTLIGIAIKYGVTVQTIMKANGMKNDVIRIGDDLTIPLPTPTPR